MAADLVSSLRRQNDNLRAKYEKLKEGREGNNESGELNLTLAESSKLQQLWEEENKELRATISRLEKLLELEREERSESEKKTMSLLNDVKKKWQDREEARVAKLELDNEEKLEQVESLTDEANNLNSIYQYQDSVHNCSLTLTVTKTSSATFSMSI